MKICIATVFDSENCGSFLQAFALKKYLSQEGHEVFFVKRKKNKVVSFWSEIIKRLLRGRLRDIPFTFKRHFRFKKIGKQYFNKVVGHNVFNSGDMDLFILGSDTIWDMKEYLFRINADLYTGNLISETPFITYAASCANTTKELIEKYNIDFSSLKKAKSISVRDNASRDLINYLLNLNAELVVDPTLLIGENIYNCFNEKILIQGRYLLIYAFGTIDQDFQNIIRVYAGEKELKTVAFGSYYDWCDLCLPEDPISFITYFRNSECIVTNTFHGTVFSTIFKKRFIVITKNKNKISDYLCRISLHDRMINPMEDNFAEILDKNIDYDLVYGLINNWIVKSKQYLKEATECSIEL